MSAGKGIAVAGVAASFACVLIFAAPKVVLAVSAAAVVAWVLR